jgi:hypothetical protein
MLGINSQNGCLYRITMLYSNKLEEIPMKKKIIAILGIIIVFVIPFASLKAQTSYEKCCAPPLFDL